MEVRRLPGLINSIIIRAAEELWQDQLLRHRANMEEQMGRLAW